MSHSTKYNLPTRDRTVNVSMYWLTINGILSGFGFDLGSIIISFCLSRWKLRQWKLDNCNVPYGISIGPLMIAFGM